MARGSLGAGCRLERWWSSGKRQRRLVVPGTPQLRSSSSLFCFYCSLILLLFLFLFFVSAEWGFDEARGRKGQTEVGWDLGVAVGCVQWWILEGLWGWGFGGGGDKGKW